jgi:hypothetical protein
MKNFYRKNNVKILIFANMTIDHEPVKVVQEIETAQNCNHWLAQPVDLLAH